MRNLLQMKSILVAAMCFLVHAFSALPARADYMPPQEFENYMILQDKWNIAVSKTPQAEESGEVRILAVHGPRVGDRSKSFTMEFQQGGKTFTFPVDRFMLAHHTDSNTICSGSYLAFTERYIDDLRLCQPHPAVLVKLSVVGKADAPVSVVGIWPFNSQKSWDRAIQRGSHVLDLSAEKVRALGNADGYRAAMLKASDAAWAEYCNKHASK